MARISDIITARSVDNDVPERIRAARDTTTGATEELYSNNVIEALGGDRKLPNWIKGVKTVRKPTVPTVSAILDVLDLHDDEGANEGKGRTALQKFIEDFPSMQKDWKETVEGEDRWGKRGWKTVKDTWKAAVHDRMLEDIKTERAKAVDDAEPVIGPNIPGSTFLTKLLFPRATEHIANTGDFDRKDILLDVGENAAMSVPGAAWLRMPTKGASIVGKGLSSIELGGTAASRILSNLPGHVANISNRIANRLGRSLPGTAALGMGQFLKNLTGNAVVPFAMEYADDVAYDEGEGMDQRADFSTGDALTGAITNQVVNRSLARLGQGIIPEATGSVEVRSPAVLKMRQFIKGLGESSDRPGVEFAESARATASQKARPAGTYTPSEVKRFRNGGSPDADGGLSVVTPEERDPALLASEVLDAIDRGDIRLRSAKDVERSMGLNKTGDNLVSNARVFEADREARNLQMQLDKLDEAISREEKAAVDNAAGIAELRSRNASGEFDKEIGRMTQQGLENQKTLKSMRKKKDALEKKRLDTMNGAKRGLESSKESAEYLDPGAYFDVDRMASKLARFDADGKYVEGIPYRMEEVMGGLSSHMPQYTNYANWHGRPAVEPSRMSRILGTSENPTWGEVIMDDAKVAVPTWAVNKAGRADMTRNLFRRVDLTDAIKEDQDETHAAPGRRVRSRAASEMLSAGKPLSDRSRKYLAYLAEHPDAVKTGHSDPKERDSFNLWLLTEGRELLEGTPLHRPTWDIEAR